MFSIVILLYFSIQYCNDLVVVDWQILFVHGMISQGFELLGNMFTLRLFLKMLGQHFVFGRRM